VMSLEWRAGKLAFLIPEIPSWQLALEPTSNPDMFIAGPGSDFSGENVIFQRHDDGRVISVLLVQGTYLRLDHDSTSLWDVTTPTRIATSARTAARKRPLPRARNREP
jgi:hypothetical protein